MKNERGELTIALSPVRVGTHWIRVCNNESKNFAFLPIFAFDDDYVPLSPVATPSPDDQLTKNKPSKSRPRDIFFPLLTGKDLTTISETSDALSSRASTISSPSQFPSSSREPDNLLSPTIPGESPAHIRASPQVQILDVTDLSDPGVRIVSNFSFKDVDNQFHLTIYGKRSARREEENSNRFFIQMPRRIVSLIKQNTFSMDANASSTNRPLSVPFLSIVRWFFRKIFSCRTCGNSYIQRERTDRW